MKHPIYTVSNYTLKKDIKNQKRIKNSSFSASVYRMQEHLEKQSERILQSFAEGYLSLEKNQYKLFAKYINIFARTEKEACITRLQNMADFDVQQYLDESQKSLWERMFASKDTAPKNKTSKRLKRDMKRYVKACRNGNDVKAYNIREDAEMYVASFLRGEFTLPREDEKLFKDYIHVILYPVYAGSDAEKAILKLRAHDYATLDTEKTEDSAKITNKAEAVFSSIKGFFSKAADKIVTAPQKIKMPKVHMPSFKMPKITLPKIKMPSFSMSEKSKRIASRTVKVAGFAGVLTVFTIWGANKCSGNDKDSLAQNNIELSETPQDSVADKDSATFHFEPVSTFSAPESFKPIAMNTETKNVKASAQTEISAEKQAVRDARTNHHLFLLNKRIGKKKMLAMIATINKKAGKDGVFSLPDSISSVDFAYAMVMYRAYGVGSSLQNAYKATTKLSAEENAQIIKDIIDAGDTGLGVKKKAEQIHFEQKKGSLENGFSLYNRLSQKDQHQHNVNLKQYRQAKKMLSRSFAR